MRIRSMCAMLPLVLVGPALTADPLTKEKLLELVASDLDPSLILGLVKRDCVDFEVDADTLLELGSSVPAPILDAAMECREGLTASGHSYEEHRGPADEAQAGLSDAPALTLSQVQSVAVIPLIQDGAPDSPLTGAFVEQLQGQRSDLRLIDSLELQIHFENTGEFHSDAPLVSLLAAARASGADAIIVGWAESYRALDDPAVRLDIKIVEVNQGRVLWTGGDRGKSQLWSKQAAKKNAARRVVGLMPRG